MNKIPEIASLNEESVKDLIEMHRVCYEWSNEYEMVNGVRTATGYSLRLYGDNVEHKADDAESVPVPGCPVCRKTYNDILCVAHWILPRDRRESIYEIEPFDFAFHFAPNRSWREEIVVTIHILHRIDITQPKDECENRCLAEMTASLKKLGVLEGRVNREFGEHRGSFSDGAKHAA
jgi:hypothetical protein